MAQPLGRAPAPARADAIKQLGVLLASGLIVGESLMGVLLAAVIAFSGQNAPLALVGDGFFAASQFFTASQWLDVVVSIVLLAALYRWIARNGMRASSVVSTS